MANGKSCPKCDTLNPTEASFCRQCGHHFSEESKEGKTISPVIKDLLVMDEFYTIGSHITLMWDVANATHLTLNGVDVTCHENAEHEVTGDEVLELVASNGYMQVSKKVKIIPEPLPKILKFEPSRHKILPNDEIKIYIETKNCNRVTLQSNISANQEITHKKSIRIRPQASEVFTLVCYSKDPSVFITRELDIEIIAGANISSFSSDRESTIETEPVILKWDVQNAKKIMLYPDGINVDGQDSIKLFPRHNTTYRLEASNDISTVSKNLTICVTTLPKISYSLPDCSELLKIPQISTTLENINDNISEIRIDKWMQHPLQKKNGIGLFNKMLNIIHKAIRWQVPY